MERRALERCWASAAFALFGVALHASDLTVPELLRMSDGRPVTSREMWERERRPEILKIFTERVFGVRPEERPRSLEFSTVGEERPVLGGRGLRRRVRATYSGPCGTNAFEFTLYLPSAATPTKPVPAFVMVCLQEKTAEHDPDGDESALREQWPVTDILARGYATIGFYKDQLSPDMDHANLLGVFSVYEKMRPYRDNNRWGTISAWAWGASRVMDYLETEKRIDAHRVAIVGHSRGGKTALLAGATDRRFAMVCSNDSGCTGAKLNHMDIGKSEHIAEIVRTFPYWFCPNYILCANRDKELDFDQHEFLALIAPRLLCVGSASEDKWAGPRGEFEAARLASPAWELYGMVGLGAEEFPAPGGSIMEGQVEYHLREGAHRITRWDWERYLDFAERRGWRVVPVLNPTVLRKDLVDSYFERFNADDEEIYQNAFPNKTAVGTIGRQIPLFECPDDDIERTYYFRWWTYRKHLRRTGDGGWVVTEFLPEVGWAGPENTIACPFGHHVREGRWLRDAQYLDGYVGFMLDKGRINGPGSYANAPAWSALERAKVTGDFGFLQRHLRGFVKNFEMWTNGWTVGSLSLKSVKNVQGAQPVPLKGGFRPERGLFDFAGDREGSEFALSADGARPLVNAMMWGEATAIAEIARSAGELELSGRFDRIASIVDNGIKTRLWNEKKRFFTTLSPEGTLDDVRELHGYAPFYFGMDLNGFEEAWNPLMSVTGFWAPKGLTFPARDTPGFDLTSDLRRHECLWNGPSWPYATSIALTALYETLQRGVALPVGAEEFAALVHQYAAQQVRRLPDGRVVPWIDENLDPMTGDWIARRQLAEWDLRGIRKMAYRERGKDYNHSTFCDLVIAGLCGVVPRKDGKVVVRPLAPKSWDWWCVDGVRYHGHDVTVLYDRDGSRYGRGRGLVVLVDGRPYDEETTFVDDLDLSGATCGGGCCTSARASVLGTPLSVGGKRFNRGFGAQSEGAIGIRLDGRAKRFMAQVGVDDKALSMRHGRRQPVMVFRVWADGTIVWKSKAISAGAPPVNVEVDLSGVHELVLETSSAAPWIAFDACIGDWCDARITAPADAVVQPILDAGAVRQLGILTPPERGEPQINGADIWGVRPGHPIIFRVATSGVRPMRFSAKGLPAGVTLEAEKGILGGRAPTAKGEYDIEVTAENSKGRAVKTIRLAVGDVIALTPPMGWNSWNIWGSRLTGEHVRAAARTMEDSGLGDHGWAYINLDDYWAMNNSPRNKDRPELRGPARDAEGRILPNPTFPDMRKLTDEIHAYGFKAGLYSSPGPTTCGGCEGSYGHELQDASRWAEWGFDYVKYDWCSYDEIVSDELKGRAWYEVPGWRDIRSESKQRPYRLMKDCLLRQDRDIVYSFCQYGLGHSEEWARDAGANSWRCWDDLKDTWPWMEMALESRIGAENYWKYAGAGCWVDLDMMIVGDQSSFGYTHPTCLTPNEQYTHVSLWCMLSAPLLVGCDLTRLDAFTRNLLVNDEVLAVDQDRLGRVARRLRHADAESIWVKQLADGSVCVALVNRYPFAREIKVKFEELGLKGERWIRDLWRQRCEGRHHGEYVANVPPHATKLIKIRSIGCPRCD